MSKNTVFKASSFLIGLLILAIFTNTVFAKEGTKEEPKRGPSFRALKDIASDAASRKEAIKEKIEERRENVENKIIALKEKQASREAALRAKLEAFKDQNKAQIAQRVSTNLNKINENQTNMMKKYLETMSSILDKLEDRVDAGKPDIKDPDAARAAISSASALIASASATVDTQALKDYTITVTSESRVRFDAKTQRDRLHADLQSVRKIVKDARQAVMNAVRVAKSGKAKEATTSGQQ